MTRIFFKIDPFLGLKKIKINKVEDLVKEIEIDTPEQSLAIKDIVDPNLKRLSSIDKKLTRIVNDIESNTEDQHRMIKCKYAATVMDKLFFYILIIYFIITFISLILSIPSFYKFT